MPIESNELYGKSFQEVLGAHLVRCRPLLSLLRQGRISHEDFDFPVIRIVVNAARNALQVMEGVPDFIPHVVLINEVQRTVQLGGVNPVELPALASYISALYGTQLSPDYYLPMAEKFLGHQRVLAEIKKATTVEGLERYEAIPQAIQRAADSARLRQRAPSFPLANPVMPALTVPVPTGINNIDSNMNGGLDKKAYGILCAYTGVGKTTLGLNFAWGAARNGFKACFATLELDEDDIHKRVYSLAAHYPYDKIRCSNPEEVFQQTREEIFNEYVELFRARTIMPNGRDISQNLQIWDFSKEECSVGLLEDWLHREQDRDPEHPPDVMFIDWLLCLGERPGFDPRKFGDREIRHKLQRYGDEISKMAVRENIAVWATHQADAKAEGKDKVTMANSAEGKSSGWKSSVFLGVGASEDNRRDNIFTVTASKMRNGRLFTTRLRGALAEQRFEDFDETNPPEDSGSTPGYGNSMADDLLFAQQRTQGLVVTPPAAPATT